MCGNRHRLNECTKIKLSKKESISYVFEVASSEFCRDIARREEGRLTDSLSG